MAATTKQEKPYLDHGLIEQQISQTWEYLLRWCPKKLQKCSCHLSIRRRVWWCNNIYFWISSHIGGSTSRVSAILFAYLCYLSMLLTRSPFSLVILPLLTFLFCLVSTLPVPGFLTMPILWYFCMVWPCLFSCCWFSRLSLCLLGLILHVLVIVSRDPAFLCFHIFGIIGLFLTLFTANPLLPCLLVIWNIGLSDMLTSAYPVSCLYSLKTPNFNLCLRFELGPPLSPLPVRSAQEWTQQTPRASMPTSRPWLKPPRNMSVASKTSPW